MLEYSHVIWEFLTLPEEVHCVLNRFTFVFITDGGKGNSQIVRSSYDYSMNTAEGTVAIVDVLEGIGVHSSVKL